MGWTAVTQDMDWASVDRVREYLDAVAERMDATGGTGRAWREGIWPAIEADSARTITGVHGLAQVGEYIGWGIAFIGAGPYALTLAVPPVVPGTLTVTADTQVVTDDGAGGLTGDGSGAIDYPTGLLRVTFAAVVPPGTPITADYTADRTTLTAREVITGEVVRLGWGPDPDRVVRPPIVPGSVTIHEGGQTLADDGNGNLTGDGTGTVNYGTGAMGYTWDDPPDWPAPTADYTSRQLFGTMFPVGRKITITGAGAFVIVERPDFETIRVAGDATCTDAQFSVSAVGTDVGDHVFLSTVQSCIPFDAFVNSNDYPGGFDGESAVVYYDATTWGEASGLTDAGHWRRVPLRAETLTGVYDPETDVTTLTASGSVFESWMVGRTLALKARGQAVLAAVNSDTEAEVAGDATCANVKFSVLPADWTDYADAAYSYGPVQPGDILGPWLWADLQAGINPLVWTTAESVAWLGGQASTGAGTGATDGAAKGAASSDFAANLGDANGSPTATSVVSGPFGTPPDEYYTAGLARQDAYGYWRTTCPLTKDVRFYAAAPAAGDWNGNGDLSDGPDIQCEFETAAGTSDHAGHSSKFGSAASAPAWGTGSPPPDVAAGYGPASLTVVLCYDRDGGFEYCG